jgi:hypothetical protein
MAAVGVGTWAAATTPASDGARPNFGELAGIQSRGFDLRLDSTGTKWATRKIDLGHRYGRSGNGDDMRLREAVGGAASLASAHRWHTAQGHIETLQEASSPPREAPGGLDDGGEATTEEIKSGGALGFRGGGAGALRLGFRAGEGGRAGAWRQCPLYRPESSLACGPSQGEARAWGAARTGSDSRLSLIRRRTEEGDDD